MAAAPRRPAFTPAERAVLDALAAFGEGARRGLYVSERVAARLVAVAHRGAAALARRIGRGP